MTLAIGPLLTLCGALDIERDQLVSWEQPEIMHRQFSVSSQAVQRLDYETINRARQEYGTALSIEFRTGDLIDLRVDSSTAESAIRSFIAAAPTSHEVVIRLDKSALLSQLALSDPSIETRLFLFTDSLCRLLRRGPGIFESEIWQVPTKGLRILVIDSETALVGPWLSIVSLNVSMHEGPTPEEVARAQRIRAERDRHIGWDEGFVTALTPAHLRLTGESDNTDLVALTGGQFVLLSLLYLCDRARARARTDGGREIRVEFRGQAHVAVIPIDDGVRLLDVDVSDLSFVEELTGWVYSVDQATGSDWVADRLPFVQTRVAQLLEGRSEPARFKAFTESARYLVEGLEWQWRAFIEGRISAYLGNRKELEAVVGDTVIDFRERAGDLVKNLSESILAAVAVLVGSFIAAAFDKPFNEDLFRIAMLAYGVYVLMFPGLLGGISSASRFRSAAADFDHRMISYRRLLGGEVDDAVDGRVDEARVAYWRWFVVVSVLYVLVMLVALIAADKIPGVVAR